MRSAVLVGPGGVMNKLLISVCAALVVGCTQNNTQQATSQPAPPSQATGSAAAGSPGPTLAQWAEGAQLFDNLGNYSRKVTTVSADAQAYFNQGLRLIYAFNHDEAARAFAKAILLDPTCAMCYWGTGEALGPNYNMP